MIFSKAIVLTPCEQLINGLTTANLGKPDYQKALVQHADYINALEECGMVVTVLPPDNNFPDSTFVEDTALLIPECAIIMNPGVSSRKGEIELIKQVLKQFYKTIEQIEPPGTADAGDIMMVGTHFYIGLSARTNEIGARHVIAILNNYGMTGSTIPLEKVLHLKTGVAYLENNNLAACGEFINTEAFKNFNIIEIDADETYAANCVWINGIVLIAQDYPKSKAKIENAGYKCREVDVSEFRKLDGGLSCLSLRF